MHCFIKLFRLVNSNTANFSAKKNCSGNWGFDLCLYSLQPLCVWSALCQSNGTAPRAARSYQCQSLKGADVGPVERTEYNLIQSQQINLTKEESNHLWVLPDELVKQTSCRHVCEELIRSPVQNTFYILLLPFHCFSNLSLQA